ncbi:aconitate hydratase 1 [Sulfodiicoccus acidiphilus]|uniref:Aconitate hydratase 1 n=1 Tax=Sulfodiicoccus acidiphilus TaxID=1670455 RepID=A0A348B1F3_9CREN|nr:aconitate hydratase 1 [Sulfodiicoccus acidiphilus]GGT92046.1 aconitate hydratase 1 [Sulfodiicoccus acidiphilus]
MVYPLSQLEERGYDVSKLPYSVRVLVENALRNWDGSTVTDDDLEAVASWRPGRDFAFKPSRVVMQDYTGVPLLVDLAAMRDKVAQMGGDPRSVNPLIQSDLVVDHSVQVDFFGTPQALELNMRREFERNEERYRFLKWSQESFRNLRIVPPGHGIVHQVNLEYLTPVVDVREFKGELTAFPDTLIGTDSHTTMINGAGVLGWGVGGLEAEAVMLGEPYYMPVPEVVGVRLTGEVREGVTPTDVVLFVTERLRKLGVVGKFVEFFGPSLGKLSVQDRATVANMAPEYGSTVGYFPIDEATLAYLRGTARDAWLVEAYARAAGLFYANEPRYSQVVELDLGQVEPSVAGPRNPDERVPLTKAKEVISSLTDSKAGRTVRDGAVAIAAITSCTNTSNPTVVIGAGLLAKRAVELGLKVPPYVKTSLAPGSKAVTEYLRKTGLLSYLEKLGFNVVGYGCTTCIGNAGPLVPEVELDVRESKVDVFAVISGNRNFEGRINPHLRGTFLTSPPLVVAYALAGRMDLDLTSEPLGEAGGKKVYLRDLWPSLEELGKYVAQTMDPELYRQQYADVFEGDANWEALDVRGGLTYDWGESTYVRQPPWLDMEPALDVRGARILLLLGDKVTTDHISPAGPITPDSPAGKYLTSRGVRELNTFGARRGNHEVMWRGGFWNPKLRNFLVEREGGYTRHFPDGEVMSVYDAAVKYASEGVPLVIFAGAQYGSGSSRDWAAKVTRLLGVRAVLAKSFERIHRSNLVAMGVLPVEVQDWRELKLRGDEVVDLDVELKVHGKVRVTLDGSRQFEGRLRVDLPQELEYVKSGNVLRYVLRKLV